MLLERARTSLQRCDPSLYLSSAFFSFYFLTVYIIIIRQQALEGRG